MFLVGRPQFIVYFWGQHNFDFILRWSPIPLSVPEYIHPIKKHSPGCDFAQPTIYRYWWHTSVLVANISCLYIVGYSLGTQTEKREKVHTQQDTGWKWRESGQKQDRENEKTCQEWFHCFAWSTCSDQNTQIQTQKHVIKADRIFASQLFNVISSLL